MPRIPEVPGFPEVLGRLTEPGLVRVLQLEGCYSRVWVTVEVRVGGIGAGVS